VLQTKSVIYTNVFVLELMGKTDLEEAKINVVLDTVNDFKTEVYTAHFEKDEAKKVGTFFACKKNK
jgi:hypothetical protein